MNTLEQVLLLEQKVESAVEKIRQLQAENDALRSKCAELTNALSSKSEQLQTCVSNNNLIQGGIQKALDQLSSIENSILDKGDQVAPTFTTNTDESLEKIPENIPVTIEDDSTANTINTTSLEDHFIDESDIQEDINLNPIDSQLETENENNHVELENKIEEAFNSSSPTPFEIPNFFGAPADYEFPEDKKTVVQNNTFDTMEPIPNTEEQNNSSVVDFDESFPNDFDPAFDEDSENQDTNGKIFW